jgi:two-component system copper resistance phosphate regulon response regulator CusR
MKILLMEPNAILARALLRGLGEERCTVNLANDLTHAKRLAESRHYDVIVLDLPAHLESAVLRHWRRMRIDCPVLFLSLPGRNDGRCQDPLLSNAAHLMKPFHFEDLLHVLNCLCDPQRHACDAMFHIFPQN